MTHTLVLKPGRDKSLRRRHPWVFSGAIAQLEGEPQAGDTVLIATADGEPLAVGAYSPSSQIAARAWSFDPATPIDVTFLRGRLAASMAARQPVDPQSAVRLVNAESDGLPGLIVDRYADFSVCQFLSAGAERWKSEIAALLSELSPSAGIYERSDVDVRGKEGLAPAAGVLAGDEPPEVIEFAEGDLRFLADVRRGHKTGFYLDQRSNRRRARAYAAGREVLNCFAYTGGFGVAALTAGARRVVNVESSTAALELGRRNFELNGLDPAVVEDVPGDAFHVLRRFRDAGRQFDLVVLDPPKFAESRSQIDRAARGYKDINLLAFKLLRPGGTLITFSCSGLLEPALFQKIVADAALDAGRAAQLVERLTQASDHRVALNFPEAEYLKGLVCVVGD